MVQRECSSLARRPILLFMRLAAILEAGRDDFLDAIGGISPTEALRKPDPGGWSVVECIEHVVIVEERYLRRIEMGTAVAPKPDGEKEARLFTIVRSRLTKVEAAEATRPRARFGSLADAVAAFAAVRDRSGRLAEKQGHDLYSIGTTHPYFGEVNGVEIVQLMDGHARRHADQIREIRDARPAPSQARRKPVSKAKQFAFRRAEPDLPREFDEIRDATSLFDGNEIAAIRDARLQDLQQTNGRRKTLRIEGCLLERVHWSGGEFESIVWKDVRLVGCDLANVRARRIALTRVELVDCRLAGFSATALDWQDVLIRNGDMRYAVVRDGRFRSCEFDRCNWQDADLQNADLTGSVFRSCDLNRADFQGATLQNADFRGSQVGGMLARGNDLRGAIVDPSQAMEFARILGLQIL